jgi:DNA-binding NarL/FixJ family response regulator
MKGVRLTDEQWSEVLRRVKDGDTVADVAAEFGISTKTIYNRMSSKTNADPSVLSANYCRTIRLQPISN